VKTGQHINHAGAAGDGAGSVCQELVSVLQEDTENPEGAGMGLQ